MKKVFLNIVLGLGWIFLGLFILSTYSYNKLSMNKGISNFQPISWKQHLQMFDGAIQCSLMDGELMERKLVLKEKVFSKVVKKEEIQNGYIYYFDNKDGLLKEALEQIRLEKECCPFFKFDISIPPYDNGFAIQISGSKEAFALIEEFEGESF